MLRTDGRASSASCIGLCNEDSLPLFCGSLSFKIALSLAGGLKPARRAKYCAFAAAPVESSETLRRSELDAERCLKPPADAADTGFDAVARTMMVTSLIVRAGEREPARAGDGADTPVAFGALRARGFGTGAVGADEFVRHFTSTHSEVFVHVFAMLEFEF